MKLRMLILLSLSLTFFTKPHLLSVPRAGSLAIVDTVGREPALYSSVIDIAREIGLTVDYLGVDRVMDSASLPKQLAMYDGVILMCGLEFIRGIYASSPVSNKFLQGIKAYAQRPGVTLGFAFPPFMRQMNKNIIRELTPLFTVLGLEVPRQEPLGRPAMTKPEKHTEQRHRHDWFMYSLNRFLTNPIEGKMRPYHTTLSPPRSLAAFFTMSSQLQSALSQNDIAHLPSGEFDQKSLVYTKPYGMSWFNRSRKNHLFITTTTLCSFSGIAESFHLCPANFDKRKEMLEGVAAMMHDVKAMVLAQSRSNVKREQSRGNQDLVSIKKFGKPLLSRGRPSPFRKIAWMELPVFEDKEYDKKMTIQEIEQDKKDRKRRQDQLVSYVFDAGLDSLWISLTPNLYYSRIAKFKHKRECFIKSVGLFTKKLRAEGNRRKVKMPAIVVGIEIADNLYEPHLPKNPAFDLYGGVYKDVPCAVDSNFWLHEVVEPLQVFVEHWKNPEISNGLALGGVMLDLEMYCRKKTGNFLSTMGFSRELVAKFLKFKGIAQSPNSVNGVASLLIERGIAQEYFAFLEQEARNIGKQLRVSIDQVMPGTVLGCYSPMILVDWFYKGLWQELSSPEKPMQLLTFNAEFNAHQEWFAANNIQVHHASVLLLSKIKNEKNFSWAKDILAHHDGIWLNRFSRLVEDYAPKSWVSIEQTPLQDKQKKEFLYYLDKLH